MTVQSRYCWLKKMINHLFTRFLRTVIYVSDPSHERDLKINSDVYVKLETVDGTTQGEKWRKYTHTCYSVSLTHHFLDTLEYFQASDHNICLVRIGFAGLTSNCHHTKELLEGSLCIHTFNDSSRLHTFNPDHLIASPCKNLTAKKKVGTKIEINKAIFSYCYFYS